MANKLIRLAQLQRFKAKTDAKYQNKLTAGSNISISNNVISVSGAPTYYSTSINSVSLRATTETTMGELTLQPGMYYVKYTCVFAANAYGTRLIKITFDNEVSSDYAYMDRRLPPSVGNAKTDVVAVINVSATDYPNGRKLYFRAFQDGASYLTAASTIFYLKF